MIKESDLDFFKLSVADNFGKIFVYNNNYYRLIYDDSKSECLDFIHSELFVKLTELKYIPKTIIDTSIDVEGHPLILWHEKCFEVMLYEWSFEMYKDAAIFMLKLNKLCNEYGYELKDAHCRNVTFNNGKPIFVDIGSFIKRKGNGWCAKNEFIQWFYLPLILWHNGDYYNLRQILETDDLYTTYRLMPSKTVYETDYYTKMLTCISYFQIKYRNKILKTRSKFIVFLARKINKLFFICLKKNLFGISKHYKLPSISEIENIKKHNSITEWQDYHSTNVESRTKRFDRLAELIKIYCPKGKTVIDLASNSAEFPIMLNRLGVFDHIIAADYDGNSIDKGYSKLEENSVVDCMWTNVMRPVNLSSFIPRVKSDIVIALALLHHLILRQHFHISVIMQRLADYSNKYVVVEFMPLGLWDGNYAPELPSWYSLEWFKEQFEKYFHLLHIEVLEKNRIVFIGEKYNTTR